MKKLSQAGVIISWTCFPRSLLYSSEVSLQLTRNYWSDFFLANAIEALDLFEESALMVACILFSLWFDRYAVNFIVMTAARRLLTNRGSRIRILHASSKFPFRIFITGSFHYRC